MGLEHNSDLIKPTLSKNTNTEEHKHNQCRYPRCTKINHSSIHDTARVYCTQHSYDVYFQSPIPYDTEVYMCCAINCKNDTKPGYIVCNTCIQDGFQVIDECVNMTCLHSGLEHMGLGIICRSCDKNIFRRNPTKCMTPMCNIYVPTSHTHCLNHKTNHVWYPPKKFVGVCRVAGCRELCTHHQRCRLHLTAWSISNDTLFDKWVSHNVEDKLSMIRNY